MLRKSTKRGLSLDSLVTIFIIFLTLRSLICSIRILNSTVMFYALLSTVSAHERPSISCFKSIHLIFLSVVTNVSETINLLFFLEFTSLFDLTIDKGHLE